jgi:hypothetical protein
LRHTIGSQAAGSGEALLIVGTVLGRATPGPQLFMHMCRMILRSEQPIESPQVG